MPCHESMDAMEEMRAMECCTGDCVCPVFGCASYVLTLDSALLTFFPSLNTPKYDFAHAGEVLRFVNSLLKPPKTA